MRIHIVSLVFPPERGAARRIGELAQFLSAAGHIVTVVTCLPNYPRGIIFPGYQNALLQKEKWNEDVSVYRVFTHISRNRQSSISRALTYLSFAIFSLIGLMAGPKPDVVYVRLGRMRAASVEIGYGHSGSLARCSYRIGLYKVEVDDSIAEGDRTVYLRKSIACFHNIGNDENFGSGESQRRIQGLARL